MRLQKNHRLSASMINHSWRCFHRAKSLVFFHSGCIWSWRHDGVNRQGFIFFHWVVPQCWLLWGFRAGSILPGPKQQEQQDQEEEVTYWLLAQGKKIIYIYRPCIRDWILERFFRGSALAIRTILAQKRWHGRYFFCYAVGTFRVERTNDWGSSFLIYGVGTLISRGKSQLSLGWFNHRAG